MTEAERLTLERDLVAASGEFDAFGYFWHNPDLSWHLCGHAEEVRHFARHGWKQLRNPHPGFDLWFYWTAYLDPTAEAVNPALHYVLDGRHRGYATVPEVDAGPGAGLGPRRGLPVRRLRRRRHPRRHRGRLPAAT